ncbi:MAG: hypothetical protein LQ342_007528 [Letrouitia transgressa]|nr:MAG: hypothetical protein LQ342_007528 [Letrouitia transgressa]
MDLTIRWRGPVGRNYCRTQKIDYDCNDVVDMEVITAGSLQDLSSKQTDRDLYAIPVSGGVGGFRASDVHGRLQAVVPEIAKDLRWEKDSVAETPFRLIKQSLPVQYRRMQPFIALSYCWHNPEWRIVEDPRSLRNMSRNFSWPITASMVLSLLLERSSLDEGLWIDQCCINQTEAEEKSRTVGKMNVIYSQARLIVVMLEDIILSCAEIDCLAFLMDDQNHDKIESWSVPLNEARQMVILTLKIFSARWFTRAWCNHELLVNQNHVFLIRVRSNDSIPATILRMSLSFLNGLVMLSSAYDLMGRQDDQHGVLAAHFKALRKSGHLRVLMNHLDLSAGNSEYGGDRVPPTLWDIKSLMDVYRSISRYGASIETDKVAITLNVVGSDLFYHGGVRTAGESGFLLTLIAFAAGDPAVLCCSGKEYLISSDDAKRSWLRRPQIGDINGTLGCRWAYRRLDYIPDFTPEQVNLEVLVLCNNKTARQPTGLFLAKAAWFFNECIEMSKIHPISELGATLRLNREIKTEILACALECGTAFIDESAALKSFRTPELIRAFDIFFLSDIRDSNFRELSEQNPDEFMLITDTIEALFSDFLTASDPSWVPLWVDFGHSPMEKIMILGPKNRKFTVVIPTLLLHKEYTNCRRVFIVDQGSKEEEVYDIIGKSTTFEGVDINLENTASLQKQRLSLR